MRNRGSDAQVPTHSLRESSNVAIFERVSFTSHSRATFLEIDELKRRDWHIIHPLLLHNQQFPLRGL